MNAKIRHINGSEKRFASLLESRIEIPFHLPLLMSYRFDDVAVIHEDDGALIVSVKDDSTQIVRPLGQYSSRLIAEAFCNGLIKQNVFLDGWKPGNDLENCVEEIFNGMDNAGFRKKEDLVFLYHDPSMFPIDLKGRKYQSLRTSLNALEKKGFEIRALGTDDMSDIIQVADEWFRKKKEKGYFKDPSRSHESLAIYKEVLSIFNVDNNIGDYEVHGIFDSCQRLLSFQSHVKVGDSAIPITKMSRENKDLSDECLDVFMLRRWKEKRIRKVFKGAKGHQPETLYWYNSKFCHQLEIPTYRYLISSDEYSKANYPGIKVA